MYYIIVEKIKEAEGLMMKKYRFISGNPTITIKVEKSKQRIVVKRPYYQIRDEFGKEIFASYSVTKFFDKMDKLCEQLMYGFNCYRQNETYVNGLLVAFKDQRLLAKL